MECSHCRKELEDNDYRIRTAATKDDELNRKTFCSWLCLYAYIKRRLGLLQP